MSADVLSSSPKRARAWWPETSGQDNGPDTLWQAVLIAKNSIDYRNFTGGDSGIRDAHEAPYTRFVQMVQEPAHRLRSLRVTTGVNRKAAARARMAPADSPVHSRIRDLAKLRR